MRGFRLTIGLGFVMLWLQACTAQRAHDRAAAEAGYSAEHLACVDQATTLAESRVCRADVDRRWGVVRAPRADAGAR